MQLYTMKDVALVLGLTQSHFAYRMRKGYYPRPTRIVGSADTPKRFYNEQDLTKLKKLHQLVPCNKKRTSKEGQDE